MNRYSEYGNDAPAFLLFFLISEILRLNNKIDYKKYGRTFSFIIIYNSK